MRKLLLCLPLSLLLTWPVYGQAATVYYDYTSNGHAYVTRITGLEINSAIYNVDFSYDTFANIWPPESQPEFWKDQNGAYDASIAINSAINSNLLDDGTAPPVNGEDKYDSFNHIPGTSDVYYVPFASLEGKIRNYKNIHPTNVPPTWTKWSLQYDSSLSLTADLSTSQKTTYTKFTVVPIPSAIWLLTTSLIGLIILASRKRHVRILKQCLR